MRSSLSRFQPITPMDEDELQSKRTRAYNEQDIYIFTPEQRKALPSWQQMELEAMAIQIYGKRKIK